jgi:outer membrane protein OmpA-like peptidoglycan-associated protein
MRLSILKTAYIAAILSSPLIAFSQDYYVVVGAFAMDKSANEFKGYLPGQVVDTSYTLTEDKNLLHFFVLRTSDKESATSKALELKKVIGSWIPEDGIRGEIRAEGTLSGEVKIPGIKEGDDATVEESPSSSASSSTYAASAGNIPPRPAGKYFKFKIETPEGLPLAAQVHHVDFDNGRELAAYSANTFVDLLQTGQTSRPMAVVCGLFGYKEIHKYIDYSDPAMTDAEAYIDSEGAWVIPYKLERVEKGDVSTMYNVSFYKDAAVMRKSSQADLDELVRMMHSNPYYEITIHAHCNGKNKREIIAPGEKRNYFDAEGSVKVMGSAKDLTTLRAEAIRAYLADNGVDSERVKIFSWGASDMLVKSDSPEAAFNNRIEIEFTRD